MYQQPTPDQPEQDERPDMIWHRPQPHRRPRQVLPGRYADLTDAQALLAALGALAVLVILALAVGPYVLAAGRWLLDPANVAHPAAEVWHTVNDPIRRSLTERGAGLPAGPATLYGAWSVVGLLILWRALRRGAIVGVQLGALVFGALTAALVWDGTPGTGRPVAAGLAVLLWSGLAALALTGSWITTHTTVINEVKPPTPAAPVVIPAPEPTPVTVEVTVPEPRIEGVVVDVQRLVVDRDGHRINPTDESGR
ncbi:hypothetical protein P3T27_006624 [Kitasatospora sp. MAA19]|uniref:hypothetical protein n=1 Tax=Kitasatospora sp. MAA19 TaxID=3035090 RepID=UPI0024737932|nr:hypothetical protein [Kitasatospora sp. MAA19]MDH6709875.1 hypothetical protein [Kitasatospora sp. MAA19]